MKKPIIVLTGPTASGKTTISLELAPIFNGAIIAADSTTVCQGMDIGTDKPDLTKTKVEHHLIDILEPNEDFNVALFQEKAIKAVMEIQKEGKIPFLVGGATMYIDALVYGFEIPEVEPDEDLRTQLEKESEKTLYEKLIKLDPSAKEYIDPKNKRRLIRALEVIIKTGKTFSELRIKRELPKNVLYLAVKKNRQELYERINERVDKMFAEGFVEEVKKLYENYGEQKSFQTAGYRQIIEHLKGQFALEEAIEKTKQAHRNYAKRQMTWLNKNQDVIWVKNAAEAEEKIKNFLESN